VIGVDEVGRGCLAGPLLVVAARGDKDLPPSVVDSKKLNRNQRESIYEEIKELCEFGEGWASVTEIENFGLTKATRLAVKRALKAIAADIEELIIVDGHINYAPKKYRFAKAVIDADDKISIVSAASIIAKVKRDNLMIEHSKLYGGYGFEKHVGYGTKRHLEAINSIGLIDGFHRRTFAPIKLAGSL
jgi:ribonuclease HII